MKKELDLRLLRAFVAVAEEGQFVRAAQRLKTSQSIISQHIKRIEDIVGACVVVRGRHGLALTEVGEVLFGEARETLDRSRIGMERVLNCVNGQIGHIRIGVSPWLLYGLAPKLLSLSKKEAPERTITLDSCNSSLQFKALHDKSLDAGILVDFEDERPLGTLPLFKVPCVLVMGYDSPLARKPKLDWGDLDGQEIVVPTYQSTHNFIGHIRQNLWSVGSTPILQRPKHASIRSLMAHIAGGEGLAFVPDLPPVRAYGLERRPLDGAPEARIVMVYLETDERPGLRGLIELASRNKAVLREAAVTWRTDG